MQTSEHIYSCWQRRTGKEDLDFYQWLKGRDNLPQFFPNRMMHTLYRIWQLPNLKDKDYMVLITGTEGLGKSTIAILMAMILDPDFGMGSFVYTLEEFILAIEKSKPGQCLILDEGILFLMSRESMTRGNRSTLKILNLCRQKNLVLLCCVPDFWTVDKKVRSRRVRMVLNVYQKKSGFAFRVYGPKSIAFIDKRDHVDRRLGAISVPTRLFFSSTWYCWGEKLPKVNDFTWDKYRSRKSQSFHEVLSDMKKSLGFDKPKENVIDVSKDNQWITLREANKICKMSRDTYKSHISKGHFSGTKINGKHYINKSEYLTFVEGKNE